MEIKKTADKVIITNSELLTMLVNAIEKETGKQVNVASAKFQINHGKVDAFTCDLMMDHYEIHVEADGVKPRPYFKSHADERGWRPD